MKFRVTCFYPLLTPRILPSLRNAGYAVILVLRNAESNRDGYRSYICTYVFHISDSDRTFSKWLVFFNRLLFLKIHYKIIFFNPILMTEQTDIKVRPHPTVHTYCDSRGTVKTLWNGYKEKLHLHLYQVTLAHLHQKTHKTDPLLTTITNSTTPMPIINWQEDPNHAFCMVSIITWNHPGLFFKLAGAFTLTGWNILSSQDISRPDQIVIDTFHVAYSSDQTRRVLFEKKVRETLLYGKNLLPEMEQKVQMTTSSPYRKATRLNVALPLTAEIYRDPSLDQTIVEIEANDKIGLLFKLAKTIFDHGYDIVFARISTENDVAIDTFYLKNIAGKEEVGSFAALEEDLRKGIV